MLRTYYILEENDKWSNRTTIFGLVYMILTGKLHGFESIWFRDLCPDRKQHPDSCIHQLLKLRELNNIPRFIFKKKLGLTEIRKSISKKFGKGKEENDFLNNAIDNDWYLKDAVKSFIIPSLRKISNFKSGGQFDINLIYNVKDKEDEKRIKEGHKVRIAFSKPNYLKFQLVFKPSSRSIGGRDKQSYGLNNELFLSQNDTIFEIKKNSIVDFETKRPYVPQIINGRILNLKKIIESEYQDQYFRLVIPVAESETKMPSTYLERTGIMLFDKEEFNHYRTPIGPLLRTGVTFQKLNIKGCDFFMYAPTDQILVIESKTKLDINSFINISNVILLANAFLSGDYYREEKYYLTSDNIDFNSVDGIYYEANNPNQLTHHQLINSELYVNTWEGSSDEYQTKNRAYRKYFDLDILNKLCEIALDNPEIKRSIEMIVEACSIDNSTLKGALYSVSLETLTNFVAKNNKEKVKPIPDKGVAKSLISEIKVKLAEFEDKIDGNGYKILTSKIENLNQPTNRDKLRIPFDMHGVNLTDKNFKTIDSRNKYLHGNKPIDSDDEFELTQIALELHLLIGKLILKMVNYEGHIMNLPVWSIWQDESRYNELIIASMQKYIGLLDQLKDSLDANDRDKYNEIKEKMKEANEGDKLSKIFEII